MKTKKVHNEIGFESKPDITTIDCDYIGPPDKVSNLRPVLRHVPLDETQIEKQLRLKRIEVEGWNQHFWVNHNQKFFKVSIPGLPMRIFNIHNSKMGLSFLRFRKNKRLLKPTKSQMKIHYQLIR